MTLFTITDKDLRAALRADYFGPDWEEGRRHCPGRKIILARGDRQLGIEVVGALIERLGMTATEWSSPGRDRKLALHFLRTTIKPRIRLALRGLSADEIRQVFMDDEP